MGIRQSSKILFTMKIPGDRQLDDYRVTLKMTRIVEEVIREYPDNWLWVPASLEYAIHTYRKGAGAC